MTTYTHAKAVEALLQLASVTRSPKERTFEELRPFAEQAVDKIIAAVEEARRPPGPSVGAELLEIVRGQSPQSAAHAPIPEGATVILGIDVWIYDTLGSRWVSGVVGSRGALTQALTELWYARH